MFRQFLSLSLSVCVCVCVCVSKSIDCELRYSGLQSSGPYLKETTAHNVLF
jgi:hypothetical protein